MMRSKKNLHEALILFTVMETLGKEVVAEVSTDPFHKKIVGRLKAWSTMRRFAPDEAKHLIELGKNPYMEHLKRSEISYTVYALELLKQWANDPDYRRSAIGVSKTQLRAGRAVFALDMLKLKTRNVEKYSETKQIIDDSVITAKKFYSFTKDNV